MSAQMLALRLRRVPLKRIHQVLVVVTVLAAAALSAPLYVLALIILLDLAIVALITSRRVQLIGTIVRRVRTSHRLVALTFDDGPDNPAHWTAVLDILRQRSMRATFFIVGHQGARRPDLLQAAVADGHELGNHTYSHRHMLLRSQRTIQREIDETDKIIRAAGVRGPIHFRPPFCTKLIGLPLFLARRERQTVLWDVEPERTLFGRATAAQIGQRVLAGIRPGSIVLLHIAGNHNEATRCALPYILDGVRGEGYRLVTVSELLAAGSDAREPHVIPVQS